MASSASSNLPNDPDPALVDCADDPAGGGAEVSPASLEVCDGRDNDCDGLVDSADPGVEPLADVTWYRDADGDGYGTALVVAAATCSAPPDTARNADDCDDLRAGVFPGAVELCDSADNDCDGAADEGAPGAPTFFFDADGDGSGDPWFTLQECLAPSAEWVPAGDDCDDADGTRGPLLAEICDDLRDNDCDGLVDGADPDADLLAGALWYLDGDGDGIGAGPAYPSCGDPSGPGGDYVLVSGDCDDSDALERTVALWFADLDLDGHAGTLSVVFGCQPLGAWLPMADDCVDSNDTVFPGAIETCDGIDQDCTGVPDDFAVDAVTFYGDGDGDGDGNPNVTLLACEAPDSSWVATGGDCVDGDPVRASTLLEVCGDGSDNDCDLLVDAADPDADNSTAPEWYLDADSDLVGGTTSVFACADPGAPYVDVTGDCNDGDALEAGPTVWFDDLDGDGFGGTLSILFGCRPGPSWSTSAEDCVDNNAAIAPGEAERCNLTDDNCDAEVDNDPDAGDPNAQPFYVDLDADDFGDITGTVVYSCFDGPPFTANNTDDCLDSDASVNPSALEVPGNGVDDDCDPFTPDAAGTVTCLGWQWTDADFDGWGDRDAMPVFDCDPLVGYSAIPADCNDDPLAGGAIDVPVAATATTGLELTSALAGACTAIGLSPGFDATGSWLFPGGSAITVYAIDRTARPILRPIVGQPVFGVAVAGTSALLQDVDVVGGTSVATVQINMSGSKLELVRVTVDPQGAGSAVRATNGVLNLREVSIQNADAPAVSGSALRVQSLASAGVVGLTVRDSSGGPASIFLAAETNADLEDVVVERSGRVEVAGGTVGDLVTFRDLAIVSAPGDGLFADTLGELQLERVLVLGSAGDGVSFTTFPSGGILTIDFATVVANGGDGITHTGMGTISVNDSLVLSNAGTDLSYSNVGMMPLRRSYVGSTSGTFTVTNAIVTPPSFVSFFPTLSTSLFDLHLRSGSSGNGTALGGEDAGAYADTDPYYLDDDFDALPDGWELLWFAAITARDGSELGDDTDAADVATEYLLGTSPFVADTDGDGVDDDVDTAPLNVAIFL